MRRLVVYLGSLVGRQRLNAVERRWAPSKGNRMANTLQALFLGAAVAMALWLAPMEASAANCNFSKAEKISMVSWIIPIAGAVITPMACRRDLFNKKNKGAAISPIDPRAHTKLESRDRRRTRAI